MKKVSLKAILCRQNTNFLWPIGYRHWSEKYGYAKFAVSRIGLWICKFLNSVSVRSSDYKSLFGLMDNIRNSSAKKNKTK